MPHQLKVNAEPDVSAGALLEATGVERPDPTGMIACPEPCNVRYAAADSFYGQDLTRYAASWEEQGDSFTFVLEYEFENQILAALGYGLRWRWRLREAEEEKARAYFLSRCFEESSDFLELSLEISFELSDFEELSEFEESSDFDLESFLAAESPFEEEEAEPVEDFLA